MIRKNVGVGGAAAMLLALVLVAAGCGGDDGGGGSGTIALLLPENHTPRYEASDRPDFEKKVKELCSDCKLLYSNATQDAAKQQNQADAALTQGADVLVLDAVDAGSAGAIVKKAKAQDVPVVSYDRLITDSDVDYYVSYDNERVGKLQGDTLIKGLKEQSKPTGPVVMLAGDPADNNAKLFKKGANDSPQGGWREDRQVVRHARDGAPTRPRTRCSRRSPRSATTASPASRRQRRPRRRRDRGDEVGRASSPRTRPTTGQDATVAGLQRILIGEQYMTVYKASKPEADAAAQIAVALAKGDDVPSDLINQQVDNGQKKVPSVILTPVAVTQGQRQEGRRGR